MLLRLRSYIIILLLFALSAFIVPKELIHEFYAHTEETVHAADEHENCDLNNHIPHIEKPHQHCCLLDFNVPVYHFTFKAFNFSTTFTLLSHSEKPYRNYCYTYKTFPSLRAPPSESLRV